jgi:hypothetical protein
MIALHFVEWGAVFWVVGFLALLTRDHLRG